MVILTGTIIAQSRTLMNFHRRFPLQATTVTQWPMISKRLILPSPTSTDLFLGLFFTVSKNQVSQLWHHRHFAPEEGVGACPVRCTTFGDIRVLFLMDTSSNAIVTTKSIIKDIFLQNHDHT